MKKAWEVNGLHRFLSNRKKDLLEMGMSLHRGIHHIQKNKVVFSSFNGKQYSCSPRFISEELHRRMPQADIVWCCNAGKDPQAFPDYVRVIPNQGKQYRAEMATAAVWVSNFELHRPISKSKRQLYIQTWHGDRGFKKVCYDAYPDSRFYMPEQDIADLCIAGSTYGYDQIRRAFRYDGEILKVGMPRNDCLVHEDVAAMQKTREAIGVPADVKIMLYAPTFRDAHTENQSILIDVSRCLDILESDGEKWVCLLRAHIGSKGGLVSPSEVQDARIIDVTRYEDMADLLPITDLLISDYSSCANDFTLTGRPVILAIFDEEEYAAKSRQFVAFPRETGHVCVADQGELEDVLARRHTIDWQDIDRKVDAFYGTSETGNSTSVIVERMMDWMNHIK